MRKKTDNKQEKLVIDALAVGKSTRKAGEIADVSQTTVMRIKEDKQNEIEEQTERLMRAVPDIVDSISRDIKTSSIISKILSGDIIMPAYRVVDTEDMNSEEEELALETEQRHYNIERAEFLNKYPLMGLDKSLLSKFLDLSYKIKTDVLRAVGVYPSQSRSIFIENLIAAGGKAVINPKVLNIVGKHLAEALKPPDIEVEEEEEQ